MRGAFTTKKKLSAGVDSMLDFWLTLGPEGESFEQELGRFLGVRRSVLVNSGSSANLVAFSALTSWRLGDRRISKGQEVITSAAGFPTTVAPIVQTGAVPVFVDNDPVTGNIRADLLEEAYAPGRTRAVMVAHTLGNPFDLTDCVRLLPKVRSLAHRRQLRRAGQPIRRRLYRNVRRSEYAELLPARTI